MYSNVPVVRLESDLCAYSVTVVGGTYAYDDMLSSANTDER